MLTHLVLVCCHATYKPTRISQEQDVWREENWILQPFQKSDASTGKRGEHETFIQHILAGHWLAQNDPQALLVFSGGPTHDGTFDSEALSYFRAWQTLAQSQSVRIPEQESFATDSYQNLLFGICRFKHLTDAYPRTITVVTHAFKERRFLELHARAIRWPAGRIRVAGINPAFALDELVETQNGELRRGYGPFAHDPYGVRPPLADKRRARHWNQMALAVVGTGLEAEVGELLRWQGGESGADVFPRRLPWED